MWPLFLLFLWFSWTPVLVCYVVVVCTLEHFLQKIKLFFDRRTLFFSSAVNNAHLENALNDASTYTEWKTAALALDAGDLQGIAWKTENSSPLYRWEGVLRRVEDLENLLAVGDVDNLSWRLGQFPVRHYCNITDPRLFSRLRAGTKTLIERFVEGNVRAVKMVAEFPCEQSSYLTNAIKLDALRAPRTAMGKTGSLFLSQPGSNLWKLMDLLERSISGLGDEMKVLKYRPDGLTLLVAALLLQAGGIFTPCHLGVVRELLVQNLLPRIVVGNQSAAPVAALVGALTDRELLVLLDNDLLGLEKNSSSWASSRTGSWFMRVLRLLTIGFPTEQANILADAVRTKLGNITFEEAYYRTKKVLNITIAPGKQPGVPSLLNHLTAPDIVIWTATLASAELDQTKAIFKMRVKDTTGALVPWDIGSGNRISGTRTATKCSIDSTPPLARMREFFNVNHFIISQARPYLVPLLPPSFQCVHYPTRPDQTWVESAAELLLKAFKHRIRQAKRIGIAPRRALRFLDDEIMEEMTVRRQRKDADLIESVTLVPEVGIADIQKILRDPMAINPSDLIRRGQRSVWPAVAALNVRCGIEVAYEHYYQKLKMESPNDGENTPVLTPKSLYRHDPFDDLREKTLTSDGYGQNTNQGTNRRRRSRSVASW